MKIPQEYLDMTNDFGFTLHQVAKQKSTYRKCNRKNSNGD